MNMQVILAILLGGSFGFVLQRIGVAHPDNIRQMLSFQNLKLLRVITFALGVSIIAVFVLNMLNPEFVNFSVKSAYVGVLIGGMIFGVGFAISGYCPGTCLVASGTGRKDALFFILGGLAGAFLFTLAYNAIKDTWLFNQISSGKVTLVDTGSAAAWSSSITGFLVAMVIGAAFIVVAKQVKERY